MRSHVPEEAAGLAVRGGESRSKPVAPIYGRLEDVGRAGILAAGVLPARTDQHPAPIKIDRGTEMVAHRSVG